MSQENILNLEQVLIDVSASTQKEIFSLIAETAKNLNYIKKPKKLIKAFNHREAESTTGFGDGFAIPHARTKDIIKPAIFFVRLNEGVDWKALDDQPVKVIVALMVPLKDASDMHLNLLSNVAQKIIKEDTQKILLESTDKNKIIKELMDNGN